jgi:hygromycin-B 7''-O-kinase
MPRMPGLQLADPQVRERLLPSDRQAIARTLGEHLARMQQATWPYAGRYQAATDTVEPFELAHELAWPLPVKSDPDLAALTPTIISYSQRVKACLRHRLVKAHQLNAAATAKSDIAWVEDCLAEANDALDDRFEPCLVMQDYKRSNVTVQQQGARWQVSGVFDLMEAHFGDGEADLSRLYAVYMEEDRQLARAFLQGYLNQRTPRPGFTRRFAVYMLLDRAIAWEFGQRVAGWWDGQRTFRDWASRATSLEGML